MSSYIYLHLHLAVPLFAYFCVVIYNFFPLIYDCFPPKYDCFPPRYDIFPLIYEFYEASDVLTASKILPELRTGPVFHCLYLYQ